MPTAVIRIDGFDVAEFYKHWDGNPENTLNWLEIFNAGFAITKENDLGYKFAQLIRSSVTESKNYGLDANRFTGWGVYPIEEGYYDYLYILKSDGVVEVINNPKSKK